MKGTYMKNNSTIAIMSWWCNLGNGDMENHPFVYCQLTMAPLCSHPPSHKLSNRVKVPLFPEKDSPIDLNIKAFVGRPGRQVHTYIHVHYTCTSTCICVTISCRNCVFRHVLQMRCCVWSTILLISLHVGARVTLTSWTHKCILCMS